MTKRKRFLLVGIIMICLIISFFFYRRNLVRAQFEEDMAKLVSGEDEEIFKASYLSYDDPFIDLYKSADIRLDSISFGSILVELDQKDMEDFFEDSDISTIDTPKALKDSINSYMKKTDDLSQSVELSYEFDGLSDVDIAYGIDFKDAITGGLYRGMIDYYQDYQDKLRKELTSEEDN